MHQLPDVARSGAREPTGCTSREHADGYVAYPIGLKGVVVGEGDNYEDALADVRSAIAFHFETFGPDAIETDQPVLEAFIAEARFAV